MSVPDVTKLHDPRRCPARSKRTRRQCGQFAGAGTDHPGVSVCRWHGGASPIRHGRYSKLPRKPLIELVESHLKDPKLLDLTREIAGARATLDLFIDRFGASLESGQDLDSARAVALTISELLERSSKIVERTERIAAQNAISQPELFRIMREMGRVVEQYVPGEETRKRIGEAWLAIQFFPSRL